jgi:hypothetical protein
VSTLLADPPAAPTQQQPSADANGAPQPAGPPAEQAQPSCSKCGVPLAAGQDWCLQCGTGAPDSLRTRAPGWRSAAAISAILALLVVGAATAAYAALSKGGGARHTTTTVARVTPPAAAAPVAPGATATPKVGTPTTIKPVLPVGAVKAPKIPLPTATPKGLTPIVPPTSGSTTTPTTTTPTTPSTTGGSSNSGEAQSAAIVLDTNAASTYNPYAYAASDFGDPSLAIDGDTTTGWTAQVEPTVAPKMAEGLVIDLHTPRKISAVAVATSTPGLTVQVYGANGQAPPTSITDPGWVALSPAQVDAKRHMRIKLGTATKASALAAKKAYRFDVLWISRAPATSVGTPQAPGHVSINELELFPPAK